jgi:transcriptional regulator with XRE-family HTH domain
MTTREELADFPVLENLGRQLASHRVARNQTQAQLAKEAGVSLRTVIRLESGASTQLINLLRVLRVLDLLPNFLRLVPQPLTSPLAQLHAKKKERKRASPNTSARETPEATAWKWGEPRDDKQPEDR